MARARILWTAAALAALAAVPLALAQDWRGPGPGTLAQGLQQPGRAFNARIDRPPTEDMVERGRLIAMGGSERGGMTAACFSCHGATGAGDGSGAIPRIAGLPGWYMYKQLMDYASGTRPNPIMGPIAQGLTEAEREQVSTYYALVAAETPRPQVLVTDRSLQWGSQLAAVGSAERGIPACVNCHGPQGSGLPPSVPYLAGQYAEYTALQLNQWRNGERRNDPMNVMAAIAQRMTDEDVAAVARYYERVRPVATGGTIPNGPAQPQPARR